MLGSFAYQQNDLAAAEAHVRVAEEMRYLHRPLAYLYIAFIVHSRRQVIAAAVALGILPPASRASPLQ